MHKRLRLGRLLISLAAAAALLAGVFSAGAGSAQAAEITAVSADALAELTASVSAQSAADAESESAAAAAGSVAADGSEAEDSEASATDIVYSAGVEGSILSSASMLSAAAGSYPLMAASALISGSDVVVTVKVNTMPGSDDGLYRLMASDVCQADTEGTQVASAAATAAGTTVTFTFTLNLNTSDSNLYKKFTVVCMQGGVPVQVSNPIYITNPEAVATHTVVRSDGGKKGLLPESSTISVTSYAAADIDQITYNLLLGDLVGGSGYDYTYNGNTYSFDLTTIAELDYIVTLMTLQGVQVTLILLNNWSGDYTTNIHPLSRDSSSENYYAFNTAETSGVELLEAVAAFLAERYSGTGHGTVDNWIIGNEINARSPWHYMTSSAGFEYFTAEYVKAFRIFYNGIKSVNANARVYTCVDQEYAVSDDAELHYAGQTFLAMFNGLTAVTGNIDWDVAVHPYDYPLSDAMPWLQTTTYADLVNHTQASAYVTMANIDVFTDFMCTEVMLNPDGQVRSILCAEQGYVSAYGEEIQAAAVVYGYLQAVYNQYIDGFILNREQDHATEVEQGLNFGLKDISGSAKLSYTWYMNAESQEVIAQASSVIGTALMTLITVR